jgi:hypothetical protein
VRRRGDLDTLRRQVEHLRSGNLGVLDSFEEIVPAG